MKFSDFIIRYCSNPSFISASKLRNWRGWANYPPFEFWAGNLPIFTILSLTQSIYNIFQKIFSHSERYESWAAPQCDLIDKVHRQVSLNLVFLPLSQEGWAKYLHILYQRSYDCPTLEGICHQSGTEIRYSLSSNMWSVLMSAN